MNSTYNVAIKIMGGTIVSAHTKKGIKPTIESVSKILSTLDELKPIYDWNLIGEVFYLDSTELNFPLRSKSGHEIANSLNENYDGVVVPHGSDQRQVTAMVLYYGLKNQRKPVVIVDSDEPPDLMDEAMKNIKNGEIIAGSAPISCVCTYDGRYLLSPFIRKHKFHRHDLSFKGYYEAVLQRPRFNFIKQYAYDLLKEFTKELVDPLGEVVDGKFKTFKPQETSQDLDASFKFDPGVKGKIKPPDIQGPIKIEDITPDGSKLSDFLNFYTVYRNEMKNADDEDTYKEYESLLSDLFDIYGVDGEIICKSFKDEKKETYFEDTFDIKNVATITYNDSIPSRHIKDINKEFKAVIIECSGCGNLRLELEPSHVPLLDALNGKNPDDVVIPTVIVPISLESYSPRYYPEIPQRWANVFGGSLYRPDEALVKLAKIIHPDNSKILSQYKTEKIPLIYLQHILFESGAVFRLTKPGEIPDRAWYEEVTKVPTNVDLLANFSFAEAAALAGEFARLKIGIGKK
jgi:L-asparaginase/Glu-tRNA(Gln) amidotransferase subunit D